MQASPARGTAGAIAAFHTRQDAFGFVAAATNSYRQALLSLIVLFIVGTVLLAVTDTDRAVRDAIGSSPPTPF